MLASRILKPSSKLDAVEWWHNTTMSEAFSLPKNLKVKDCYKAMDWLIQRQDAIQKRLAKRLLSEGCTALYALGSCDDEGSQGTLAEHGYSSDKKRGRSQINYGLLCDHLGRPVSISTYEGNIHDHNT